LLIVPAGCDIAVVGAVESAGLPAAGGVAGTLSCAIAPLANIAPSASIASRIAIGVELFISCLTRGLNSLPSKMASNPEWVSR
jgi:hypothetical protein